MKKALIFTIALVAVLVSAGFAKLTNEEPAQEEQIVVINEGGHSMTADGF